MDTSYLPHGLEPLWPEGYGRDFTLDFDPAAPTPGRILAPLAPHQGDMLAIRSINQPLTVHQFEDRNIAACGENVGDGAHGTGTMLALTAGCAISRDGEGQFGTGPSIDQHVARELGAETPLSSMVLTCGGSKGNHRGFISYDAGGPIPPMGPEDAYYAAFGSAVGADDARLAALREQRRSALDLIREDAGRIRRRLPADARAQMDAHLESLRALERGYDSARLCEPSTFVDPGDHFPGHFERQAQTVAAAIACDVSRVFCVMASSGGGDSSGNLRYFDPEWTTNYHSTGHASGGSADGGGDDSEVRRRAGEVMIRVSEFYAQWVSDLITALKAIPEGTGSVFDNTVILWATEMSNGNHKWHQWPWFVFGGGWHFTNGWYENAPTSDVYERTYFGDLLAAVAQSMVVHTPQFGVDIHTSGNPDAYSHLWRTDG